MISIPHTLGLSCTVRDMQTVISIVSKVCSEDVKILGDRVSYLLMGWMDEGWKQVSWSCMELLNLFSSSSSNFLSAPL